MDFNICVTAPLELTHAAAFTELVKLMSLGLTDLGHTVTSTRNVLKGDRRNIIVGCHLIPNTIEFPPGTIFLNTEQMAANANGWTPSILHFAKSHEMWDYDTSNIKVLMLNRREKIKLMGIGYHPGMVTIPKAPVQDIDVLFYGSINGRRQNIITKLENVGLNVKVVFDVYGEERDALISRSKVVLNIHHFNSQVFEIVRVFHLMCNSKAVVCEVNTSTSVDKKYLDGVAHSSYDGIVQKCVELVGNEELRLEYEQKALKTIQQFPQADYMCELI